jgi:cytochrome bd-type quinol oxidase subunit 2
MSDELRPTSAGIGRVLIAVYGILALAALGRSGYQIATKFAEAPVAYSLSALAAVVYVLATIALIARGTAWYWAAVVAIGFELAGVLIVGTLSIIDPALFPDDTVWSQFGRGYAFIPLVLPVLGLLWLRRVARARRVAAPSAENAEASA